MWYIKYLWIYIYIYIYIYITNSGVIGSWQKQSLPSKIQTKGRSDINLWERRPDDGPHHIQLHKYKRAKRQTQTPNKQTDQITGQ
jgi:hypothetical protein